MRQLRIAAVALVIVGVSSITWAQDFKENFDSYAAGSALHGVGGWKGWDNTAGAGAPVSNKYAFSGKNSVEVAGATDLVHEYKCTGGRWVFSAMQYCPSGTSGITYFIVLNTYNDGASAAKDWSVQTQYDLATGAITPWTGSTGSGAQVLYDRWVELKFIVNLGENTFEEYYDGELIAAGQWDDNTHGTLQALDLYANNAEAVYYDDIKLERYYVYKAQSPDPADGATGVVMPLMKWVKGDNAVFHDVYFGTSPELTAADLKGPHQAFEMYFYPMGATPGTTYYWRVDEIKADGTVTKGDVWSFTIAANTAYNPNPRNGDKWIDPNTTLTWYPGQNGVNHDLYFGTDQAAVVARDPGVFKGSVPVTNFEPGTLAKNTTYYWVVDELNGTKYAGDVWSFTTAGGPGGGVKAEYFTNRTLTGTPFLTQIEPEINHAWGDPGGPAPSVVDQFSARWTADLEIAVADTYTFITNSDDGVRLWLDDKRIINNWTDHAPTNNLSRPIKLDPGIYSLRMEYYEAGGGATAQLSWETPTVARQIIPAGPLQPPVRARAFYPANGDVNVPQSVALTWTAGDDAVTHDVYFGTDQAAVAAATQAEAGVYLGSQMLENTSLSPGPLEGGKTYYWRVDEVNDAAEGSPWKGMAWNFTTAAFLVVDNFESYTNDSPYRLFQSWVDGVGFSEDEYFPTGNPGNGSSSAVGHDIWSQGTAYNTIVETGTVHGGRQSMPMDYNNVNSPYYSEAVRTWKTAQNWTVDGADTLVLYVQGRNSNQAGRLYVALEDSTGKMAVVTYANDTAVTSLNWIEWKLPLSGFAGVKATAIKKMYIGVGNRDKPAKGGAGTIFVDDIKVIKAQ